MIRTAPLLTLTPPLTLPSPLRGEGFVAPASLASLGEVFGADEDLPRLRPLAGADDMVLLHHVDEARGLRIAETEPPLQERDGRRTLGDDEVHRVPVDVVALAAVAFEDGARVHLGGHLKGDARGEVPLEEAGNHVHRGTLLCF